MFTASSLLVADIAHAIARANAPTKEKLDRLQTAIHHHNKMMLVRGRRIHNLVAATTHENWAIIKAHIEQMVTIFEAIIREASKPIGQGAGCVPTSGLSGEITPC